MGGNHEFKFGFGYRKFDVDERRPTGAATSSSATSFGPAPAYTHVARDVENATREASYWSVYLGDTFTKDRLTLNARRPLRPPDRQQAVPPAAAGNASFPNILGRDRLRRQHSGHRVERHLAPGRA